MTGPSRPVRTAEHRRDGCTVPDRAVLLCGVQRAGTTLVCDLLTTTDRLGYPKEFFLDRARPAFLDGWSLPGDTDDATFLARALRNGTSPNGVFAAKLMADQLGTFARTTGGRGLTALPDPVVVWLRRRDALASAVSQWRAEVTGVWSATARTVPCPTPTTADLDRIGALHDRRHAEDERWRRWLDGRADVACHYEDWVGAPDALVGRIADAVGVDLDGAAPRSRLVRQADEDSRRVAAAWARRSGGCTACRPEVVGVVGDRRPG